LRIAVANSRANGFGTISGTTKQITLGNQTIMYIMEMDAS
jgi:hypothetical protein